eukprot:111181-Amorphochlora_amoeboformis.AAC.1
MAARRARVQAKSGAIGPSKLKKPGTEYNICLSRPDAPGWDVTLPGITRLQGRTIGVERLSPLLPDAIPKGTQAGQK